MTTITALPPAPSRSDPVNFADEADAFVAALPTFGTEANALAVEVNADAAAAISAASTATTQAGIATTQAGIATAQASAALASANSAAASYDLFDDRWLGAKVGDPSTDNDGQPLTPGVTYFNTSTSLVRIYNGTGWQDAVGAITGNFVVVREVITATAGQTIFNLANSYIPGTNTIMVYLNGVRLLAGDYTETNSTRVTLTTGASAGDELLFEMGVVNTGSTVAAGLVTVNPVGGVAATNAQAAIQELDAEKVSKAGDTMTGALAVPAGATGAQVPQVQEVVRKIGDTMTGDLTVPSINGGQLAGLRNKIINGKMEIAQRGTSFSISTQTSHYTLDRFVLGHFSNTANYTVTQSSDAPSGFRNSFRIEVTAADTSISAADASLVAQYIEGFNVADLIGQTFTISFRVRSSKTGVHCVSLRNSVNDRSYVAEYTINAANTWEQKSITVSGGLITAGTWNWTNGLGLQVGFTLASGSNYQTTAGAWQTGNFFATANQVNCLDTIGNIFAITGVQLEVGSVATPFEHRPYGMELALCQRYYYRTSPGAVGKFLTPAGLCNSTTLLAALGTFPVPMRVTPTAVEQSGTAADYRVYVAGTFFAAATVPAYSAVTTNVVFLVEVTSSSSLTTGQTALLGTASANAFLGWSAEL